MVNNLQRVAQLGSLAAGLNSDNLCYCAVLTTVHMEKM